jgi:hypothetical protein
MIKIRKKIFYCLLQRIFLEYKFRCLFLSNEPKNVKSHIVIDFNQKYWKWLIILLCAAYCIFENSGKGDFYIFLSAADDLKLRENIFDKKYVDGYHYYYSVLFALILKPFAAMPFFLVKFFWLFLNALLFFNLLQILYMSRFAAKLNNRQKNIFLLFTFIVSLRFFINNIHHSQITILILWCCIKGLVLISENKPVRGALILAWGINIKLLPIVFVPYLIYRGYFIAALLTIGFYIFFMFFPSLIIGHEYNMTLLSTWGALINPTNQIHVLDVDERSFHGLTTLLATLFVKDVPDVYALKINRNIADVSIETLSKIILVTRLILIAITLYFLKLKIFVKAKTGFLQCVETSYILLLIPLIFPHQQHYAFLFAIPAFTTIMYFLIADGSTYKHRKTVIALMIFIGLCFNLKLLLGEFNDYYDHFKLITYCALLLIPLLADVSKKASGQMLSPAT